MIKCHINRKKRVVRATVKGNINDITVETLGIIQMVFSGIAKDNSEAGKIFKKSIIGGVLDPKSPVWEWELDSEGGDKK